MLELSRDIGDFLFALLQVPLDYIQSSSLLPSWFIEKAEEEPDDSPGNSGSSTHTGKHSGTLADQGGAVRASRIPISRHESIRSVSDTLPSNVRPSVNYPADSRVSRDRHSSTSSLPAYSEDPPHDPPRYSQTLSRHNGHQIWYPPASAYATSGHEVPVSTHDLLGTAPEYQSPEWRTYPAFPSAYPPTPLPVSASLPISVNTRSGAEHRLVSDSTYPPIPEDEQGFGEMLERVHEEFPGSVHSSSNNNKIPPGVNTYEEHSGATRQPDEDALLDDSMCSSEAGLSEDDFGSSLRTPHRHPAAMPSSAYSSDDDLPSALTTTSNASSMRTKTSSDSLSSGSSSLAGRKRTHGTFQGKARSTFSTSDSRNATLRGRPAPSPIAQYPPQSSTSDGDDESEVGGGDGSTKAKRQRVLDPLKRNSTLRPVARGSGNVGKGVLSSRNTTVRNRPVPTLSQAPTRTRAGSSTTINSTIRERKPTSTSRQVVRFGPQGVMKSSSTSSSQSGTLKGRA